MLFLVPCILAPLFVLLFRNNERLILIAIPPTVFFLVHIIFWMLYTSYRDSAEAFGLLKNAALSASVAVVCIASWMTWLMMTCRNEKDTLSSLALSLKERPFATVVLFLTLFSLTTFFIGYALAFDDKALRSSGDEVAAVLMGLYAERLGSAQSEGDPGASDKSQEGLPTETKLSALGEIWHFQFDLGKAEMRVDAAYMNRTENLEDLIKTINDVRSRKAASNGYQIDQLAKKMLGFRDREKLYVVLAGHANDDVHKGEKGHYGSNLELSEARANEVMMWAIRRLGDKGMRDLTKIQWLKIPVSNQSQFLANYPQGSDNQDANKHLSVEVAILASDAKIRDEARLSTGRPLLLLDYIYFAAYTITTTGYGDIKPVSQFSKLVVSLANLFEVFFMVIFFNVLLSFLDQRGVGGEAAA